MTLSDLLHWRARTPRQVIAERLTSAGVAWLIVAVWILRGNQVASPVVFGVMWTVVMVGVGIPLGLRRLRRDV